MDSRADFASDVAALILALKSDDRQVRLRAGNELAQMFDRRVPRVLPFGPPDRVQARQQAIEDPEIQQALALICGEPLLERCEQVARVRCQCGDPEGIRRCEQFAAAGYSPDIDETAAYSCCNELGRLGSPAALDALCRLMTSAARPMIRVSAAECLAVYGLDAGRDLIRAKFESASKPFNRLTSAIHLTRLGDADAARILVAELFSSNAAPFQNSLQSLIACHRNGVLDGIELSNDELLEWVQQCMRKSRQE